ncbi:MAG: glycosyltransferase [Mediterranea sp.]|jgi:glycosyltransferase involved in cell wall biosynthesis|nr:glycosyltransferase [Mediterranea sp.]
MPEITVLMPVRNGGKYIKDAIDSVLQQSFEDFEFLIMDDGSTDNTVDVILSYSDSRIRLVKRRPDFVGSLNEGLSLARGIFIARMDADDIMHSERLRIQHKRMIRYPEITLCSTWIKPFADNDCPLPVNKQGDGFVKNPMLQMLQANIFAHPSIMMRKSFLQKHNLRYQEYPLAEDYKLWTEIAKAGGHFYIEPQFLLNYRVSSTQITATKKEAMLEQTVIVKKEILDYLLRSRENNQILLKLYEDMTTLEQEKLVHPNDTFQLFWHILNKI